MKLITVLVIGLLTISRVQASEAELRVKPNKCVALKKGQVCYQTLQFNFKVATKSDFCLIMANQTEPLKCWKNTDTANFRYRLASTRSVEFKMQNQNAQTLASTLVSVAWVYKQNRKRNRWRLF